MHPGGLFGRLTADAVTTLASSVDGVIRRLETAYDTAGRPYLFTSYDAASSGNVVNQVQREYNGVGQLIKEYKEHSGAVNTSTSPKVQYEYSEMTGGANHSRSIGMTYPVIKPGVIIHHRCPGEYMITAKPFYAISAQAAAVCGMAQETERRCACARAALRTRLG